ncbi:hypothetical protein [Halobacillus sp. Marseille-Q1614]|uniref:hypothetical protein n=1 Tax=Halobacillus sp. Marseille-Q1614 TaxID=2709134 RepID=UPI0015713EF7|nr:hypothetical protein [Halobacillus sp. Marseille-Q1614]
MHVVRAVAVVRAAQDAAAVDVAADAAVDAKASGRPGLGRQIFFLFLCWNFRQGFFFGVQTYRTK